MSEVFLLSCAWFSLFACSNKSVSLHFAAHSGFCMGFLIPAHRDKVGNPPCVQSHW